MEYDRETPTVGIGVRDIRSHGFGSHMYTIARLQPWDFGDHIVLARRVLDHILM